MYWLPYWLVGVHVCRPSNAVMCDGWLLVMSYTKHSLTWLDLWLLVIVDIRHTQYCDLLSTNHIHPCMCNENITSQPQIPMWHAPCATMKREPNLGVSVFPHHFSMTCRTCCWVAQVHCKKTQRQGTWEDPRTFFASSRCIQAINNWQTKSNGMSQDS